MTYGEAIAANRVELRRRFGKAYERLSEILFEVDPARINFETNTDEYEAEVDTILPRLKACDSVAAVERVVEEELRRCFGREHSLRSGACREVAERIWGEVVPLLP